MSSIPPFIVKKLSDHFGQYILTATCKCGHMTDLDPWDLGKRLGWETELVDLASRLKCWKCGKKECELTARDWRRRKGVNNA